MWYPLIIQHIIMDSASDAIDCVGYDDFKEINVKGFTDNVIAYITAGQEN